MPDTKPLSEKQNSILERKTSLFKQTVLENPYILHKPQILPDGRSPQTVALLQKRLEVLYGGAAGGGKSDWLLMAALQYAAEEDYSAIIFRKTFTDLSLPGALIERSHSWLDDSDAHWDNIVHTWNFPSGAKLAFAYLQHDGDEKRYKSAEFQFVGFDQVEEIPEHHYKFLFSRVRRLRDCNIPLRVWSTANPDGLPWVKQRFISQSHPQRVYIPAKLTDNQYLDTQSYIAALDNLDPIHRKQLLEGDWEVTPGGKLFQRWWFTGDTTHHSNLVELRDVPRDSVWFRVWDLAATAPTKGKDPDYTVGTLCTYKAGILYIIHVERFRDSPMKTKDRMRETANADGLKVMQYTEEEGGSGGKFTTDDLARNVFAGLAYKTIKAQADKATRAGPLATAAERGNVKVVSAPWVNDWLDELTLFPDGVHDDQVDTAAYALIIATGRKPRTRWNASVF